MDAVRSVSGKTWAIGAGVVGFVVVLALLIALLVSVNRTHEEVDDIAKKQGIVARTAASQVRALGQAVSAVGAGKQPVRAAVLGSMPGGIPSGGQAGAPYRTAVVGGRYGIPFPTEAAVQPAPKHPAKDSIWADPLPVDNAATYKGALARQSASDLGGNYAMTSNKELFHRKPDELDARDIDVARDAFPAPDDAPPKNGNEAIAAMYSFENFRAAMDRNGPAGYLAPTFERQGWSKLGARDPCLWKEQMAALRDEFPKNMSLAELEDSMMVPIPDQFYDFFYSAAEARGIPGMQYGCDGMGAPAAGRLYEALRDEWTEGKRAGPKVGSVEGAAIMRDSVQSIPLDNAQAALRAIGEIAAAREQAAKDRVLVPEPTPAQLQALANWSAAPGPVRGAADKLARQLRMPLPPADYV